MTWLSKEIDFEHYTKIGVIKAHYPLHKITASRDVQKSVAKFSDKIINSIRFGNSSWVKYLEPVHMIKKYYGERFGFYYLYLLNYQAMLFFPAVAGLLLFAWQMYNYSLSGNMQESVDSAWNGVFGLFLAVWGSIFIEAWRKKEDELIFEWDLRSV